MKAIAITLPPKFAVDPVTGCWNWTGYIDKDGYGRFRTGGKGLGAHRISYEAHVGPIPPGMLICHRCNNRACVNPDHLYAGTGKDNTRDSMDAGTARCLTAPPPPQRGELNRTAKLTAPIVVEIRQRLAAGERQPDLASRYGVDRATINHIACGRTWKHVVAPC